eukprot:CAMPEP_0174258332 /NCGR_PEP_ID=MMETSP0439-20130205/7333_1 /TAXON_ID=0 /ORGANISM="Stereomyxa ramosa, Strain Chinc5" /LENGTH=382 /DNA_ID=CAMNT_0015341791 /DNA_START=14 /DNA_END=1162 /DNA_ORIENTATION=+
MKMMNSQGASRLDGKATVQGLIILLFVLVILLFLRSTGPKKQHDKEEDPPEEATTPEAPAKSVAEKPEAKENENSKQQETLEGLSYEQGVFGSVSVYWKMPPKLQKIQGIVLFFHGCNHDGVDAFVLPMEREFTLFAMQRSLAVVSFDSLDREGRRCWGPRDKDRVNAAFVSWKKNVSAAHAPINFNNLPVIGSGASSGGNFLGVIIGDIEEMKHIITIVAVPPILEYPKHVSKVAMVLMELDPHSVEFGNIVVNNFGQEKAKVYAIHSRALHDHLFSDLMTNLTASTSEKIFETFKEHDMLNFENHLVVDPRHDASWKKLLEQHPDPKVNEVMKNHIKRESMIEILNMCFGFHEMTSQYLDDALDWMILDFPQTNKLEKPL